MFSEDVELINSPDTELSMDKFKLKKQSTADKIDEDFEPTGKIVMVVKLTIELNLD